MCGVWVCVWRGEGKGRYSYPPSLLPTLPLHLPQPLSSLNTPAPPSLTSPPPPTLTLPPPPSLPPPSPPSLPLIHPAARLAYPPSLLPPPSLAPPVRLAPPLPLLRPTLLDLLPARTFLPCFSPCTPPSPNACLPPSRCISDALEPEPTSRACATVRRHSGMARRESRNVCDYCRAREGRGGALPADGKRGYNERHTASGVSVIRCAAGKGA